MNDHKIYTIDKFVSSKVQFNFKTLDSLSKTYFQPDFIKMDIEGGEMEALLGCERLLLEKKPHLVIEVHSKDLKNSCCQFLKKFEYHPRLVRPRKFLNETRPDVYNGWLICEGAPRKQV